MSLVHHPAGGEASSHRLGTASLFQGDLVRQAAIDAIAKLSPRKLVRIPVMFVVEIVAGLTSVLLLRDVAAGGAHIGFTAQVVFWL